VDGGADSSPQKIKIFLKKDNPCESSRRWKIL